MRSKLWTGAIALLAIGGFSSLGVGSEATFTKENLPEWLKRTDLEFHKDSQSPDLRFSLESIQPLFQTEDLANTLFVQGRASYKDDDWTTNLGLGYRYLFPDNSWILGVNGWWDRSYEYNHARWGLGAELIGPLVTGRANYYDAYTGWRTIEETVSTFTEEKALDGYDLELEAPAPYMPWMRVSATYYQWDAESIDDVVGFSAAVKMDLTDNAYLEGRYSTDTADTIFGASLRLRFGAPQGVEHTAFGTGIADVAFQPRDLRKHVLDKVERHHDIVVERRTVTIKGGFGAVRVYRGT